MNCARLVARAGYSDKRRRAEEAATTSMTGTPMRTRALDDSDDFDDWRADMLDDWRRCARR